MIKLLHCYIVTLLVSGLFLVSPTKTMAAVIQCFCASDIYNNQDNLPDLSNTNKYVSYCNESLPNNLCNVTEFTKSYPNVLYPKCVSYDDKAKSCAERKQIFKESYDTALARQTAVRTKSDSVSKTAEKPVDKVGQLQESAKKELNPAGFGQATDFIGRAITMLMAFIGSITVVLYVYAGIVWMTAAGNSEQAGKAKTIIVWTTFGVAVMLASYMIVNFVFENLGLGK